MKKKIWIINHYAGNMLFAKGGRHYWFADFLHRDGYSPVVFACNNKHDPGTEVFYETDKLWEEHKAEEIDTPFIYVKARPYSGNGKDRIMNMVDFYRNVKKSAKEYAAIHGKPDVIYASSVHPLTLAAGIQLAKYFGVKCICEVRDLWPESIFAYSPKLRFWPITMLYAGEKWLYRHADAIIMTWPGGKQYIIDRGWDEAIPSDKITYISNGIDLDSFLAHASRHVDDVDLQNDEVFTAVYTGTIRKVNNLSALVDAAAILWKRNNHHIKILIWGKGDDRQVLEERVQREGLGNISFKGSVPKEMIPSILSCADCTILHNSSTSLNRYGQSQNKFFEYLAAGKPILMTYTVGFSICRERKCGFELQEQEPLAIANALERISALPNEEYMQYCENASDTAKDYDYFLLTKELQKVIEYID